jgi:hypothetical protein
MKILLLLMLIGVIVAATRLPGRRSAPQVAAAPSDSITANA